jgi:hypothetical protein
MRICERACLRSQCCLSMSRVLGLTRTHRSRWSETSLSTGPSAGTVSPFFVVFVHRNYPFAWWATATASDGRQAALGSNRAACTGFISFPRCANRREVRPPACVASRLAFWLLDGVAS